MNQPVITDSLEAVNCEQTLHLAIGMFDGVHLGHQAVIESALHSARRTWGIAGVLTFDPHPSRLFRPDDPTLLLMPVNMKTSFLQYLGVELIVNQAFTDAFATIEAAGFMAHLKKCLPKLSAIYVGENFRFGRGRKGDIEQLVHYAEAENVTVFSVERIKQNGLPISSTRIRQELSEGNIEKANALLGYSYRSEGRVIPGKQLGRKIGIPTLNLIWEPELKPRYGVYTVRVKSNRSSDWSFGIANYGVRPTVEHADSVKPLLEVHLFSETELTAGDELFVEYINFIRPEQKFASLEALQAQIAQDIDIAKKKVGFDA